jgi:hypothetical protein
MLTAELDNHEQYDPYNDVQIRIMFLQSTQSLSPRYSHVVSHPTSYVDARMSCGERLVWQG